MQGAEAISALGHEAQGVVVLGAHPSASAGFLVPLIAELSRTHPEVRIELTEGTTPVLTEKLVAGQVDLALRNTWPEQPDLPLTYESLWHEPFVAVIPEDHPLAALPEPFAPVVLSDSPLISIGRPGNQIEPEVARVIKEWDADLDLVLHTEQPQTLANLVRVGLGIGLINSLAMQISDTAGLALRRVGLSNEGRTVGVWWDQDRYMSSASKVVLDAIREAPVPPSTRALNSARAEGASAGGGEEGPTPVE
ncbi:substrate-binding domain-containing protein [Arthrobacter subterraneus]|uniref:substrate-binding domain-containing protein n=1 Tax=Arthrobacter subterraneus TaxID=335973 RepID=UPI0038043578